MEAPHRHDGHPVDHTLIFESLQNDVTPSMVPSNEQWKINTVPSILFNTTMATELLNGTTSKFAIFGPLQEYTLFWVAYYLNQYYLWVIFAFGFPGNIVSFITILHMKPFTSPTIYVAALAFVDNTCLVCKILFFTLTKYDARIEDGGCGVLQFLGSFTAQFANWLLVAMTVERCVAICLPLKVGSICTRKLHMGGLVVMTIILLGVNIQHFLTQTMVDKNGDYSCQTKDAEYSEFLRVWFWVDGVFYAILPAILLIAMNTLIILGIRRSAKIQRELTNKATQVAETMRQKRQITIMLVIVCIAFVFLITPHALFYVLKDLWVYKEKTYDHAKYLFTNQLIFVMSDSTHAINFYLYFFSTRRFRKSCLETMFYCCLPNRMARRFRGSTISGMSKTFRLSVTDVTTVPPNTVPMTNFSSSSSSSSNHQIVANGDGKVLKYKSIRDGSHC